MGIRVRTVVVLVVAAALAAYICGAALANGGPFVVKYPGGDPAAKGILARLDPNLKPGRETRLRVVKEDLRVTFEREPFAGQGASPAPVGHVWAEYTIQNPTSKEITVDFGFPILRGIYISPSSMMPVPDTRVEMDGKFIPCRIISNSLIYGIIRGRARETVENAIADDRKLADLVAAVFDSTGAKRASARKKLADYLTSWLRLTKRWNERDAALLVEYASLDLGKRPAPVAWHAGSWSDSEQDRKLMDANLGPLAAMGEQKATQFFAQLASRFDPKAADTYEAIFTAWGGDVRERSVDLLKGNVRPREIVINRQDLNKPGSIASYAARTGGPTIYARVDYLDSSAKITDEERASLKSILKNLPVVFTFAPMNLVYYQATFPSKSTRKLTVSYRQYAYADTGKPETCQLAYVVHPASMWNSFGPISLEVAVPANVLFRASVPCKKRASEQSAIGELYPEKKERWDVYRGTVTSKKGEIFLAIASADWRKAFPPKQPVAAQGVRPGPVAERQKP